MQQIKVGRDTFQVERTVELKPGQFHNGQPSEDLAAVVNHNGADDIVWRQGDKFYLSSGRWTQSELPTPERGAPVRAGRLNGLVELFKPEDNTEGDAKAAAKAQTQRLKEDTTFGHFIFKCAGAIGAAALVGNLSEQALQKLATKLAQQTPEVIIKTQGYRVAERVVVDNTPKLLTTISKHSNAVLIGTAVAAAGLTFAGAHAFFKSQDNKVHDQALQEARKQAQKPPDYDMANLVGTPIQP